LLKIVKVSFLRDKRITLPFEIEMRKISSVCWVVCIACCFAACTKSDVFGPAQYKAQAAVDDKIISEYLTKYNLTSEFKHVQNNDTIGVFYRVVDSGAANSLYTNSTQITVGDTGMLLTLNARKGQIFFETDTFHPTYTLGQLIKGWQYGVPEVGSGGEVEVIMASRYAYGHYPQTQVGQAYGLTAGLPGDAILDFYIRLYDVTN
jgi:FKBP-type peptidyl-prolyl cis-trans isomerase FkpA